MKIKTFNGVRFQEISRWGNVIEFYYEDVEGAPASKGVMPLDVWNLIFDQPEEYEHDELLGAE